MDRILFVLFCILILTIGGGAAWYLITTSTALRTSHHEDGQLPADELHEGVSIYTNGTYGFSLIYPDSAELSHTFEPLQHLGTSWRTAATPEESGVPVVQFTTFHIQQDHAFPRSYTTLVRIGVSDQEKAVASCLSASESSGETARGTVSLNGQSWESFSIQDAGMMQYLEGVSYRTLHEGRCIAVEKLRSGSSYRDESETETVSQEELDAQYNALDAIVRTITLVR